MKEEVKACIVLNHLVSTSRVVLIQIEKRTGVDMLKKAACFSFFGVGGVLWAGQEKVPGAWCCISGLTICVLKSVTALQEKSQNGVLVF